MQQLLLQQTNGIRWQSVFVDGGDVVGIASQVVDWQGLAELVAIRADNVLWIEGK